MDTKLLILLCVFIAYGPAYSYAQVPGWVYSGDTAPELWSTLEGGELCSGTSQSPIDIQTDMAVEREFEPWSSTGYDSEEGVGPRPVRIFNNGRGFQVDLEGDYLVRGGGLPGIYRAFQFHLHWGSDSSTGSEHTKDGRQYPGELHFAHYNDMYDSILEAAVQPEGIAAFQWFIEIGEHNEAWDPIFNSLSEIKYNGSSSDLPYFKPAYLLPSEFNYFYRYRGSFTSPPCLETIIWTVNEMTIKLSEEQFAMLRNLSRLTEAEAAGGQSDLPIVDNYRPVQPLNMRTVYHGYADFAPWDGDMSTMSCVNKCGNKRDEMMACQCDSLCRHNGDCCEDYMDNCMVEICTYVPTFKNKMRKQHPREMMDEMVDEPRPSTDTRTR